MTHSDVYWTKLIWKVLRMKNDSRLGKERKKQVSVKRNQFPLNFSVVSVCHSFCMWGPNVTITYDDMAIHC